MESKQLIQILLPLYNNEKEAFPSIYYSRIREELTMKFGGVTAHSHAPATGLWKENDEKIVLDKIIIYEVMTAEPDIQWWTVFKRRIEGIFHQEEIVIRAIPIEIL